jgi:hypothetical protein
MASQSPDTWGYSLQSDDEGNYPFDPIMSSNNDDSNYEETRYNIYASGAIVEDKLFFYGIFNPQDIKDEYANANELDSRQYTKKDKQADYWLAKVDWFINDEHNIGFTALNNEWEQSRSTRTTGDEVFSAPNKSTWGGSMWSANYSGIITDEITINAIYGVTEQTSDSINPTADHSPVWDRRDNWGWEKIGSWVGDYKQELRDDQRTQFRLDLDWEFGDHTIRFGYSQEVVETSDNIAYAGDGKTYEYRVMSQGTLDWLNGKRADIGQGAITGISAGNDYYRAREYDRVGTAESTNTAIYIQDTWRVTDEITLNIGLRNSAFESKTGEGDVYADMDNQWAPRLGAI